MQQRRIKCSEGRYKLSVRVGSSGVRLLVAMFLGSLRKTPSLRLMVRACERINRRSFYVETISCITPAALDICSMGLDTIPSLASKLTSLSVVAADTAATSTPQWPAWAPEITNPTLEWIVKIAPVGCLSYLLVSPLGVCRQVAAAKTVRTCHSCYYPVS